MTDRVLAGGPKEITFVCESVKITPAEVFELMYARFDNQVTANVKRELGKDIIHSKERRKQIVRDRYKLNCSEGAEGAKSSGVTLPNPDIDATIGFADGSYRHYVVMGRTDFDPGRAIKRPNVVFLRNQKTRNILIMREARQYPLEELITPFVRKVIKKFDKDATAQFYNEDKASPVAPGRENYAMHIPEPHLLAAFEHLKLDGLTRRLTPKPYAIAAGEDRLWYLRDFFSAAVDAPLDVDGMASYFGTIEALGVMEVMDRQVIHYCFDRTGIVNYDPDFVLQTRSRPMYCTTDWANAREIMETETVAQGWFLVGSSRTMAFRGIREASIKVRNVLYEKGVNAETLFRYLRRSIDMAPFDKIHLDV